MNASNVTINGTWSRTSTSRSEVHTYRKSMRSAAYNIGGYFDAVCRREPLERMEDGDTTLHGTFTFTVPITRYKQNSRKVALSLLQALMFQNMCRPPKVKVTSCTWVQADRDTEPVL